MDILPLLFFILLTIFNLPAQGSQMTHLEGEKLDVKGRLKLLNKPAMKSFHTKYGDIVDCVDINKQLAFDHPLLKNHSIQMKPSFTSTKISESTTLEFIPKNKRCPQGTVPIKRIQEEDLAMENFKPLFGISTSNITNVNGHQMAGLIAFRKNWGVSANVNVFYPTPEVLPGEYSSVSITAGSDDGGVTNAIQAGWMVVPNIYPNSTRLFSYWTKDSGKTGCFNTICPGFVQTSKKFTLGLQLPVSKLAGDPQVFADFKLQRDNTTTNWWLIFQGENIGYWPKELFSTLQLGAAKAGWGAEIYTNNTKRTPGMGSGYQPDAGYSRSCMLRRLSLTPTEEFPTDFSYIMTDPIDYSVLLDKYRDWGYYIYVGGPHKL